MNFLNYNLHFKYVTFFLKNCHPLLIKLIGLISDINIIYNYKFSKKNTSFLENYKFKQKRIWPLFKIVSIYLKMVCDEVPILKYIELISRPSYKKYTTFHKIKNSNKARFFDNYPIWVLHNSKYGLITNIEALKLKVGGKIFTKIHIFEI